MNPFLSVYNKQIIHCGVRGHIAWLCQIMVVCYNTSHDGADEHEDTEENVASQNTKGIDDLSLADDEDDAKNLSEEEDSWL